MKRKPTRFATGLLGGLCAIAALSCTSKEEVRPEPAPKSDAVTVTYAQTQCADRWGQAPSAQQLVAKAQAYLAQQGLTLNQPQAAATGQASTCAACTCPTGLVLEATVSPADLPAVLALGFTKK
jgi:hypothetical protein